MEDITFLVTKNRVYGIMRYREMLKLWFFAAPSQTICGRNSQNLPKCSSHQGESIALTFVDVSPKLLEIWAKNSNFENCGHFE